MNTFTSFDGIRIAYHDEGEGPAVILLHGFGVDGLGQFGDFERIRPILEKRQEMFREVFVGSPPLPNPPVEGRPGLLRALRAVGARTIVPDMRGFGASDKPTEKAAYADSALARDVMALIDHLRLDAVDVIGFSMGAGTTARLLMLRPPQVKSAIIAGVGDYALEDGVMEFPKSWPVPDSVPRPITSTSRTTSLPCTSDRKYGADAFNHFSKPGTVLGTLICIRPSLRCSRSSLGTELRAYCFARRTDSRYYSRTS